MFRGMEARIRLLPVVAVVVTLAAALPGLQGCKKNESAKDGGPSPKAPPELVNRTVPGTPLELRVPATWTLQPVDPGPAPEAPAKPDGGPPARPQIELRSRTLLSARAPEGALGEAGRPWLMVLHDPFLPAGTTSTDYLEAQRASNQGVARMEHVEAERSRRQGRPTYHVRDEWDAPFGDKQARMSQEALLLIDAEDDALHGYAVVLTLLEEDRKQLATVIDEMFDSVRFEDD